MNLYFVFSFVQDEIQDVFFSNPSSVNTTLPYVPLVTTWLVHGWTISCEGHVRVIGHPIFFWRGNDKSQTRAPLPATRKWWRQRQQLVSARYTVFSYRIFSNAQNTFRLCKLLSVSIFLAALIPCMANCSEILIFATSPITIRYVEIGTCLESSHVVPSSP